MAAQASSKPANRPSRRQDLIDAAIELFSRQAWDVVTVADIVERAGMTSAAFYYHFASREQLLEEVVENFAARWVELIEGLLDGAQTVEELSALPVALLDEIDRQGHVARIFFANTGTAPAVVDRCHGEARQRLVGSSAATIRRLHPERDDALATVNGIAMVCLYETAVRAYLSVGEPFRTLGPRRYRIQLTALSEIVTGAPRSAPQ